jgi:hypothetical protein
MVDSKETKTLEQKHNKGVLALSKRKSTSSTAQSKKSSAKNPDKQMAKDWDQVT